MRTNTILVPVLLLAVGACVPPEPRGRVLLIGVDGMSPRLVVEMMEAGELPYLRELAERGASGTLRPGLPLLSPRIWTSIATGRSAEEHGILHFVHRDEDGRRRLYTSSDRRVPALWNIVGHHGRTVAVVNWLMTQPPEKVNGVMISDHAVPGVLERRRTFFDPAVDARSPAAASTRLQASGLDAPYAYPQRWQAAVANNLQASTSLTAVASPFTENGQAPTGGPAADFHRFWTNDELVARTALQVRDEARPDLLMVYLPGIDRISHFFWPAVEAPDSLPPARRLSEYKAALDAATLHTYYRFTDALVARLSEGYGAEDLVLVISDHGFEAGTEPADMPGVHRSEAAAAGIFYLRGRDVGKVRLGGIDTLDVAPLILAWLGLPGASDMSGGVPAQLEIREHGLVATYDDTPVERPYEPESGSVSAVEDEILDELRALDYIE